MPPTTARQRSGLKAYSLKDKPIGDPVEGHSAPRSKRTHHSRRSSPAFGRSVESTLTPEECLLVVRYRDLNSVAALAIRCYILTGDLRLVRTIYDQVCLGIRPR